MAEVNIEVGSIIRAGVRKILDCWLQKSSEHDKMPPVLRSGIFLMPTIIVIIQKKYQTMGIFHLQIKDTYE